MTDQLHLQQMSLQEQQAIQPQCTPIMRAKQKEQQVTNSQLLQARH